MKYGCHNQPRSLKYFTQYGLLLAGFAVGVWIENVLSRDCRYDKRATDKKCAGCTK